MRVLHANWSDGYLHLWAERCEWTADSSKQPADSFSADAGEIRELLALAGIDCTSTESALDLRLPCINRVPISSLGAVDAPDPSGISIETIRVNTLAFQPAAAASLLLELMDHEAVRNCATWHVGSGFQYFREAARLARHVLAQQRFVPMLVQNVAGELHGCWYPWLSDTLTADRVSKLVSSMPAAARCVEDHHRHSAGTVTEDFIAAVVDECCRTSLIREDFGAALDERDPEADPHVAWLATLLAASRRVTGSPALRQELVKRVKGWISLLEDRGASSAWRLMFKLAEPPSVNLKPHETPDPSDPLWTLSFHLQSLEKASLIVDADDLWLVSGDSVTVQGRRIDRPQELLLGELGRAIRLYRQIESVLEDSEPTKIELNTKQAYEFLREIRPLLIEQGFAVQCPEWWDTPGARLGARLRLDSPDGDPAEMLKPSFAAAAQTSLGVGALVNYQWEIAIGDTTISLHEFEQLAGRKVPLVRVNGRWVEIRPEDVQAAVKFIRENPGGKIQLADAMRLAFNSDLRETGIGVVGVEARGWLGAFLNSESTGATLLEVETPLNFKGTLRPYQTRGVSWLVFQERLGFGVCLADDMGLGKTIQLLALLAWEREFAKAVAEHAGPDAPPHHPTILVVPMSVVGNWIRETARFCPDLRVLLHHGQSRLTGPEFEAKVHEYDIVITTYALCHRDRELLSGVKWGRVVLDEAHYIKNPASKQSQAARSLQGLHRVALTGTPVENRLSELWSIMDFLNPGYLGSAGGFRQKFVLPIERHHDRARRDQLRGLIRPFILRRLKSDPSIAADLPAKSETKDYLHATQEQRVLYRECTDRMLRDVEDADGIKRRGIVLAMLVRLKQICDHPALYLKEEKNLVSATDASRSVKCMRLLEKLDEIVGNDHQALVFTQFREMGELLVPMIQQSLQRNVLFLHGGTSQTQRDAIVEQFQRADGSAPVLVLSLRAGGVGLNLTAATHVFHFDRWWNPAVENQATDRAYRIGQTRNVQVHKFILSGTLEERIDQLIEEKSELAETIVGAGENWLAELNTEQLRDILTLRNDAIDDEI
ncbi:MAG: DEAD/DEAH box helicase [Phycisphaerales bacterium]